LQVYGQIVNDKPYVWPCRGMGYYLFELRDAKTGETVRHVSAYCMERMSFPWRGVTFRALCPLNQLALLRCDDCDLTAVER
jgi:hypothetical protein